MITTYMGREVGASIGLLFTVAEVRAMGHEELRKDCYQKEGHFFSVLKWKGNRINVGVFDTENECNDAWDRAKERRKIKDRVPSRLGFTLATVGTMQRVNLWCNGVNKYIGTFKTKKLAREAYLLAFHAETERQLEALN